MKSTELRLKIGYLDMINDIFCSELLVMASQLKPFTSVVIKKDPPSLFLKVKVIFLEDSPIILGKVGKNPDLLRSITKVPLSFCSWRLRECQLVTFS